jgi:hypothetical protein
MKKRIINLFICLCIFFIGVILVSCDLTKTTATHIMIVGDGITYDGYQSTSAQPLALINGENSSFYYQISALDDNGGQSVIQDIKHEVKNVTSNLQIISEKGTNNLTLKFNSGENILNINTTISLRLYSRSNSALSINVEISCYFYDAKSIVDETIIDQQTNNSYISTSTSSQDTINYLGHAVDYNNQALPIT